MAVTLSLERVRSGDAIATYSLAPALRASVVIAAAVYEQIDPRILANETERLLERRRPK